jgi:hypothetical protein
MEMDLNLSALFRDCPFLELKGLDLELIKMAATEVKRSLLPWKASYGEYQTGGWETVTVLGKTIDAEDGEVTDCQNPVLTQAADQCPTLEVLLDELHLRYMKVRLAKMCAGACIWEHRDYLDLSNMSRLRIQIPLETNLNAALVMADRRYHMQIGHMYGFVPTAPHAACNRGNTDRIHLVLDVYNDEHLTSLVKNATPASFNVLPPLPPETLHQCLSNLSVAQNDEAPTAQERAVLDLYFQFQVPVGALYAALEQACLQRSFTKRANFWRNRQELVLGVGLDKY